MKPASQAQLRVLNAEHGGMRRWMHRRVVGLAMRGGLARLAWEKWKRATPRSAAQNRLAQWWRRALNATLTEQLGSRFRQWQRTTWLQGAASDTSRVAREREVKLLLRRWGNGSKQRQALYRSWRQWREVTREAAVVEVQTASQALVAEEKARVSVEYEQKLLALDELCSKDTAALEAQLQEKAAAALALEKRVTELEAQLKVNATENNIFLKVTHAN